MTAKESSRKDEARTSEEPSWGKQWSTLQKAVLGLQEGRIALAGSEVCRLFSPLLLSNSILDQSLRICFKRAITLLATGKGKESGQVFRQGIQDLSPRHPNCQQLHQLGLGLADALKAEDFVQAARRLEDFGLFFLCLQVHKSPPVLSDKQVISTKSYPQGPARVLVVPVGESQA